MVAPGEDSATRRRRAAPPRRRAGRPQRPGPPAGRAHDTREVLDEVARQARRLLGVDVAYIMLLRDGRLRIEVVDGAMGSAHARASSSRPGEGLGGRCSATGRPLWSESYLADTRFPHAAGTDSAARSEQLGGILGVPLVVGDDTLGVLLAAERRPRVFVDHDVELLAGLAAHAAARPSHRRSLRPRAGGRGRAARGQRGTARRRREPPTRQRPARRPQRGGAHRRRASRRWSPRSTARPGWSWRCATSTAGPSPGNGWPPRALVVPVDLPEGHVADLLATTDTTPGDDDGSRTTAGALPDQDDEPLRLLRIGATTVAVLIASERSVAEAELRSRGGVRARPAVLWHRRGEPGPKGAGPGHRPAGRRRRRGRRPRAGGHDGRRGVRVPVGRPPAGLVGLPRGAGRRPRPGRRGRRPRGLERLSRTGRHSHDRARRLHRGAVRRPGSARGGPPDDVPAAGPRPRRVRAAADDLGLYRSLFSRSGRTGLADLHPVRRWARCSTTTGSGSATSPPPWRPTSSRPATTRGPARSSTSTPNTLYQRLDRITEVLGPQWKEPGRALELQVALRLHRLLAARPD